MIQLNCYYFSFLEDIPVSYYGPTILKVDIDTSIECVKKLLIEKQSPYQIHAHNIDDITLQLVFHGDSTTCIKLTDNQISINSVIPLHNDSESYTIHWYLSQIKNMRYQLSTNNIHFDYQSKLIYLSDDMKLPEIKTKISDELNIPINSFKILHMNDVEMNHDKTLAQLGITPTTSYPTDNQMYRHLVILDN